MLRMPPAPKFVHRVIAWARDGKWLICPCCGGGFGSHQVTSRTRVPSRLYNRLSHLCPACVASHDGKSLVITPPQPCSCPDCGHVETSLVAMGRHIARRHTSIDMCS